MQFSDICQINNESSHSSESNIKKTNNDITESILKLCDKIDDISTSIIDIKSTIEEDFDYDIKNTSKR